MDSDKRMDMESLMTTLKDLEMRCSELEKRLSINYDELNKNETNSSEDDFITFMYMSALAKGITSSKFKRCPPDYYDQDLEWRKNYLEADSINHLLKSIIVENTKGDATDCSDISNSRYYCIVVQYTKKFNAEKVAKVIAAMNPGISLKKFKFRLAEDCADLTGYDYNSVTPLNMKTRIPVILSDEITKLKPPYVWMGGGQVDLKYRVDIRQFIDAVVDYVLDVTD